MPANGSPRDSMRAWLPVAVFRVAMHAFPKTARRRYGSEMVETFQLAYATRRRLGSGSARQFALRATLDALRAGARERRGRGGVGSSPPKSPLGRWASNTSDRIWREHAADLNHALRALVASPTFALTILLVLALGVGVNTALFTALKAAVLNPSPYPNPTELVILDLLNESENPAEAGEPFPWSYPKYKILESTAELGAAPIAAYARHTLSLTGRGDAVRLTSEVVTTDYFVTLGIEPAKGRWPVADAASAAREVVLSHRVWSERFDDESTIPGAMVTLSGQSVTVVGVAPAWFRGLSGQADLWIPMSAVPLLVSPTLLDNIEGHWLQVVGRLRAGATTDVLRSQMDAVAAQVEAVYPWSDHDARHLAGLRVLEEARRNPRAQRAVLVLGGAALLVLLIACANLGVLMLARGADRRREIAVRMALGGSRGRVTRVLVFEVFLLSTAGALLGLLIATRGVDLMATAWPDAFMDGSWNLRFVEASSFQLDAVAVLFAFGLALTTSLLFSLGPALRLARTDLAAAMRDGGSSTPRERLGGRRTMVAVEIAIALMLLIGAALMASSLGRLLDVEKGFDSDNLLTFTYQLPRSHPAAEAPRFHDELLARIRALPGVVGATQGYAPLDGYNWMAGVRQAGATVFGEDNRSIVGINLIDEQYFSVLGIAIQSGRGFNALEGADDRAMVVINATAAREWFGDTDPLGMPFATGVSLTSEGKTAEIIGVVGDVLYDSPAEGIRPESYFLHRQEPGRDATPLVRTVGEPFELLASIRAEVAAMDPDLPIYGITTVEDLGAAQVGDSRVVAGLLSLFAGLALLLATTGTWGVVATSVSGRSREVGIRIAVGADSAEVVRLMLWQGMSSVVAGAAFGLLGALALSGTLSSLLYEVRPTEPRLLLGAALLMLSVAGLAAFLPARKVARLDPVETLRAE